MRRAHSYPSCSDPGKSHCLRTLTNSHGKSQGQGLFCPPDTCPSPSLHALHCLTKVCPMRLSYQTPACLCSSKSENTRLSPQWQNVVDESHKVALHRDFVFSGCGVQIYTQTNSYRSKPLAFGSSYFYQTTSLSQGGPSLCKTGPHPGPSSEPLVAVCFFRVVNLSRFPWASVVSSEEV